MTYLEKSTKNYPTPEILKRKLRHASLKNLSYAFFSANKLLAYFPFTIHNPKKNEKRLKQKIKLDT